MSDDEKRKSGSGSDESGEEDAYEVQEIRDKRRGEDGDWLYYVKWVGWESDTNTWEPVEHLQESKDILRDFESKWRSKQERKEERRRQEREQKIKDRRERELKAAARLGRVDSDSDGGGGGANEFIRKHKKKEKKKERERNKSESGDSGEERKRREERKQKQKEREKEKDKKSNGGNREEERRKSKDEEKKKEPVKPKYFRDIKPEKILGVTTGPGELHFYIQWEEKAGVEPGLVTAKEAYSKIPQMCLKYYEENLFWNKRTETVTNKKEEVKESVDGNAVTGTQQSEVKDDASNCKDDKSTVGSKDEKPPESKDEKPPVNKDVKPSVDKDVNTPVVSKEEKTSDEKDNSSAPKESQEKAKIVSDLGTSDSSKEPPPPSESS